MFSARVLLWAFISTYVRASEHLTPFDQLCLDPVQELQRLQPFEEGRLYLNDSLLLRKRAAIHTGPCSGDHPSKKVKR